MIQSEYAKKHGIPAHIVQRASYGLPSGRYFEEKQMDEAMIRLLESRIEKYRKKMNVLLTYVERIAGNK